MMLALHIHTVLDKPNESVPECAYPKHSSLFSKLHVVVGYFKTPINCVPRRYAGEGLQFMRLCELLHMYIGRAL